MYSTDPLLKITCRRLMNIYTYMYRQILVIEWRVFRSIWETWNVCSVLLKNCWLHLHISVPKYFLIFFFPTPFSYSSLEKSMEMSERDMYCTSVKSFFFPLFLFLHFCPQFNFFPLHLLIFVSFSPTVLTLTWMIFGY